MRNTWLVGLAMLVFATAFACGGNDTGGDGDGGAEGDIDATNPDDRDGDGFANDVDNCPDVYNPDQLDFDDDGLGDPCDPDPPPETCGDARVDAERIAPNVLVVLDRSLSMEQNGKWQAAIDALDSLSDNLADVLRLGLELFAGDGDMCAAPELVLAMGDHTATEFQASYAGESPAGATPMRLALERPRTEGWLDDASDPDDATRSKNVLLVTDGQPNCAEGHENDYNYSDLDATVAAAEALHAAGVFIWVVGFGNGVDQDALNLLAETGGTDNPNDAANNYYQADNAQELEDALLAIGAQVTSCTLELAGMPADPTRIYVLIGGTPIVRDDPDGFIYDEATNTIVLQGAACDAVKVQPPPTVDVIFGCPPDGGPPIIE